MKTVFNNSMVTHVWAQRTQPYGRSGNGSISFDGAVLLSYRTPIALFCKGTRKRDACLISSQSYSHTTAKHQSDAWRAVSGVPVFRVPSIEDDHSHLRLSDSRVTKSEARKVHKGNLAYLIKQYADCVLRNRRARSLYFSDTAELALSLIEVAKRASSYAELFGLPLPKLTPNTDAIAIWAFRAEREARLNTPQATAKRERDREQREERAKQKLERELQAKREALAESITKFRNGEPAAVFNYALRGIPPMLRVHGDTVQTSHGAAFPLDHALRALPFILRCQRTSTSWVANGHSIPLGHFMLTNMESDGGVRAGCHYVRFSEIALFIDTLRASGLFLEREGNDYDLYSQISGSEWR